MEKITLMPVVLEIRWSNIFRELIFKFVNRTFLLAHGIANVVSAVYNWRNFHETV